MKQVAIFGAGQAGQALYKLLHHSAQQVIAFGDNRADLQGRQIDGVPILPLQQVVALQPEEIYLAIVNREACVEVEAQLRAAGYQREITRVNALREQINLRFATLRLLVEEMAKRDVQGALAELGVYKGEFAAEINRLMPDRTFYLFDTFEGFDQRDVQK